MSRVSSWPTMGGWCSTKEKAVVKSVELLLCERCRGSYMCETEYDLNRRTNGSCSAVRFAQLVRHQRRAVETAAAARRWGDVVAGDLHGPQTFFSHGERKKTSGDLQKQGNKIKSLA